MAAEERKIYHIYRQLAGYEGETVRRKEVVSRGDVIDTEWIEDEYSTRTRRITIPEKGWKVKVEEGRTPDRVGDIVGLHNFMDSLMDRDGIVTQPDGFKAEKSYTRDLRRVGRGIGFPFSGDSVRAERWISWKLRTALRRK